MRVLRVRDRLRAQTGRRTGTVRTVIVPDFTADQQRAVDAPFGGCLAIVGAAGTGKSTALAARAARAKALDPAAKALFFPTHDRFDAYALRVLEEAGTRVRLFDDVEAEAQFAVVCAPLFALDWDEFVSEQLDPEVPGLRSPNRFLESAFRLIRKLRDARIGPHEFLSRSLTGATEFYAKPPNFADPALLLAVKDVYHDSLAVTPAELQRQYRREIDLAKILAKLYERYGQLVESSGCTTGRDAIDAAIGRLRAEPGLRIRLRGAHRFAFVDDAEELTRGELQLLQEVFGPELAGVTVCGDPASAISSVRAASPDAAFAIAGERVELKEQHRSPPAIELACRQLISAEPLAAAGVEPRLALFRGASPRDEAAFIAERVGEWLASGTPPDRIAVMFRSIRHIEPYENALLDRNVPIVTGGDANVFADRRALDALALLWNVYDPFRHDWLLRTLGNPAFGLSDASLATLCGEPPNPQTPLFVFDDERAPTVRSSRWDPKRDLRLGWNVVRGERDGELCAAARSRVERFRASRLRWLDAMNRATFERFARTVWRDGLAREGAPGSARAGAQQLVLRRLLGRLSAFLEERRDATVADALDYARRRTDSDLESCEDAEGAGHVRVLSIEAARGREFDRVVVAGVRAGAFPRWYVPDAFLFSPRLGMVPKENAGDARAARTAKFSYYMFRNKAREKYNARERQALVYALRRARVSALVTASQKPSKGVAAPELFEELRRARLPGTQEG
ncbi:MAG: 3'-5' exonuclease [Candidatus Tumulicola sp.]